MSCHSNTAFFFRPAEVESRTKFLNGVICGLSNRSGSEEAKRSHRSETSKLSGAQERSEKVDRSHAQERSDKVERSQRSGARMPTQRRAGQLVLIYYRKHGSASYIVRQWLLWVAEREREKDACDVIDIMLKSRVIMHMITSTARPPYYASTGSEPVECSNFEVHVKTRSLALER